VISHIDLFSSSTFKKLYLSQYLYCLIPYFISPCYSICACGLFHITDMCVIYIYIYIRVVHLKHRHMAATVPIVDGAATWWRECRAGSSHYQHRTGSVCDTCVLRSGGNCSSKCIEWMRPSKYNAASFNSCASKARRQVTFCVE
jgi:hypothetical protein